MIGKVTRYAHLRVTGSVEFIATARRQIRIFCRHLDFAQYGALPSYMLLGFTRADTGEARLKPFAQYLGD